MANQSILFELTGQDKLKAVLRQLGPKAGKAAARALYSEAEEIMARSKRIVPVDTGNLRNTGHVEAPEIKAGVITVEMGYGDTAVGYSVYVHEDLTARHAPGQQAKYLEQPAREAARGMEERLAETLKKDIKP